MQTRAVIGFLVSALLFAVGCAHTPTQPGERADLVRAARHTLAQMESSDPSLRPLIDQSVGYIVFPAVGEGGFLIGGGAGSGVLFENGRAVHFAELHHLEAGALVGGERQAEVVVIRDRQALDALRSGRFDFGAKAQAVIVRSGAAANATFEKGVAVFIKPVRGAYLNASLGGQRIKLTL